ncbi:MAG: Eco57I restriction-modification methylase domain-containing protein [Ignavibacteriae bacterium]|nr:Eco57I restriction-modification methylase domain-containing protein [Ignavibacteriota bacterium]
MHYVPTSSQKVTSLLPSLEVRKRGAIYTRQEVVEFILDLVGYDPQQVLESKRLLEPACGEGSFLIPAVKRLLQSIKKTQGKNSKSTYQRLKHSIRAVELHQKSFEITKNKLWDLLIQEGVPQEDIEKLLKDWLIQGDFLLIEPPFDFNFVIGNPPYIRQELLSADVLFQYRQKYKTMYDRADIYVAFIEKSLKNLIPGGQCGMICSDRWMKNRYGGPLRDFISSNFHLRVYVDMTDSIAFDSEVTAYPAITVIANDQGSITTVASNPTIEKENLRTLALSLTNQINLNDDRVHVVKGICRSSEPWVFGSADSLTLVRRLEDQFPLLEETGCKIGIGVATGADDVYIASMEELDIEDSRKIPLVMTGDIINGQIMWSGHGVVNPYLDEGSLVDLDDYPKLQSYLESQKARICRRHVATKDPIRWYRTIDRINPTLTHKQKLLLPDISGQAQIIYESGQFYPHHNLYYITSDNWNLRVLQGILISGIAHLFVEAYSTQMRGKYLRFQAQYLRRIRIPYWENLSSIQKKMLSYAATQQDPAICDEVIAELYSLSENEMDVIRSKRGSNAP